MVDIEFYMKYVLVNVLLKYTLSLSTELGAKLTITRRFAACN